MCVKSSKCWLREVNISYHTDPPGNIMHLLELCCSPSSCNNFNTEQSKSQRPKLVYNLNSIFGLKHDLLLTTNEFIQFLGSDCLNHSTRFLSTAWTRFVQRKLLRVWSCVVTWRVWRSTAKAIYLNLTLDGQLWVETCGSDVVWWQTGSQWDSWHHLSSTPGCIMMAVVEGWGRPL